MPSESIPRKEHLFWEGAAQMNAGPRQLTVICQVILDDRPQRALCIDILSGLDPMVLLDSRLDLILTIPGDVDPIGLLLQKTYQNAAGQDLVRFAAMRSPVWMRKADLMHSGRAMAINFAQYGKAGQLIKLTGAGWRVLLTPLSEEILAANKISQDQDYRFTHQIDFSREDASAFNASEMKIFLDQLHIFLSFCRGRWVALAFVVTFDTSENIAAEQWGIGRQNTWQEQSGWLDRCYSEPIVALFRPFMEKLSDESWKELFHHVVYWFSRAETDTAGVDGACVLLQATLERFAWQVLVRDRKALSEKAFLELSASDNLRLMLNWLGIPAEIPSGLCELQQYAKGRKQEGPEVFTTIRNSIAHPPKLSRKKEKMPYYDAYLLAKWYVELAVLSVCGYKGDYHNRTSVDGWVGQIEKVPWIKAENPSASEKKGSQVLLHTK